MHNPNKLTKLTLDNVSCPKTGRSLFKGMKPTILLILLSAPIAEAGEPVEPMRRVGGSAPVQDDPTAPGSKFEGMRRVGGTQPWEREKQRVEQEEEKRRRYVDSDEQYVPSYPAERPTSQEVQVKDRPPTLDEARLYGEFRRGFMTTSLSFQYSMYLPDYIKIYFINGYKVPGAPHPADYCKARFDADVEAGLRPPLHERVSWENKKAKEKFHRENPDANPWAKEAEEQTKTNKPSPQPERDKVDEKFGKKTNKATESTKEEIK